MSSFLPLKRKSGVERKQAKKGRKEMARPWVGKEEDLVGQTVRVVMANPKVNVAQFPMRFREMYGHVDIKATKFAKWRALLLASNVLKIDSSNFITCKPSAYKLYSPEDGTARAEAITEYCDDALTPSSGVDDLLGSALEGGSRGTPLFRVDSKGRRRSSSAGSISFTVSDSDEESDDSDLEDDSADEMSEFTPIPVQRRKAIDYF